MYCSSCGTSNEDAARFCQKCGAAVAVAPRPSTPPTDARMRGSTAPVVTAAKRYAAGKNPAVAIILSLLIVGLGQFYNGDAKKGGVMLAAAIVGGLLTFGVVWLGMAIWSAIDAYNVASGKSAMW